MRMIAVRMTTVRMRMIAVRMTGGENERVLVREGRIWKGDGKGWPGTMSAHVRENSSDFLVPYDPPDHA